MKTFQWWPEAKKLIFALAMATAIGNSSLKSKADGNPHLQHPLTVADSIEMTHFVDPPEYPLNGHPKFSPDRQHFLLVTEKGNLESNSREFALLVGDANAPANVPVRVAAFSSSSNRNGIDNARWLGNDIISFAGENPGEVPQVYVVNIHSKSLRKLTSEALGIAGPFSISEDTKVVIYNAPWTSDEKQNQYKDQHGFALSTERIFDLASGKWNAPMDVYQTYILHTATGARQPVAGGPLLAGPFKLAIWLSPDGKYAVAKRPPFPVPTGWESYDDKWVKAWTSSEQFRTSQLQPSSLSEAELVDTETGTITPLLDAPQRGLRQLSAFWLGDGRSLIMSETYLPLAPNLPPDELEKRKSLGAVVEIKIPDRTMKVIAYIPKDDAWTLEPNGSADAFKIRIVRKQPTGFYAPAPDISYRRNEDMWVEAREKQINVEGRAESITLAQQLDQWPKLVLTDPTTQQDVRIYDPNPQLHDRRFGRVQTIHWKGKAGEEWIGGLVFPVDYHEGKRYPLVIQTHGFDPGSFLLDGEFTTAMAAQELANKEIAVLQIGNEPDQQTIHGTRDEGAQQLSGMEGAIDYLDQLGLVDRNHVGVVGFSRTAYHVKYALTHSKYHFAAATIAEGIDFGYWMYLIDPNTAGWWGQFEEMWGGLPWRGNWDSWMDSISFNFDKIHTPVRLETDSNPGSIVQEWETFSALKLLHKPVEMIFIPHGSHPLVKPWERMTSQQGNVDWMVFWLKGEEDPDPVKAEQYSRWRELQKLQDEDQGRSKDSSSQ